jgi:hypothetical protein
MRHTISNSVATEDVSSVPCVSKQEKIELIRKFQRSEGNFDCFSSPYTRVCKQIECLWRDDCLVCLPELTSGK